MSEEVSYVWVLGPILIGVALNTFLFGINICQFFAYYTSEFGDPLWIKCFVSALLLVDIAHSCTMVYIPWFFCVKNYNNPSILGYPVWAFLLTPFMDSIAAFITQIFLGLRVFKLTQNLLLYAGIFLSTLSAFVLGMIVGVKFVILVAKSILTEVLNLRVWSLPSLDQAEELKSICIPWVILHSGTDMIISVCLCHSFWISKTGNRQTDWALRTLLRKAIQTGLPVAITAILFLVTYVQFGTKASHLYATFALILGRIYTLTLLDTLIVRKQITKRLLEPDVNISHILSNCRAVDSQETPDPDQFEFQLVRVYSASVFKEDVESCSTIRDNRCILRR